ncbi:hypothetical protein GEV33_011065 [Tenebrio molitor]|uniref:Uncharacterized protein n=1 Tax=Tenebrio molitor TaxID=7067 RepID=A0A8J6HC97_TENMO|nr:hypothetical protein GEV33_011065 [Tenebrio molitor]
MRGVYKIFLAFGQEEDGGDCGLIPPVAVRTNQSVGNGRRGSQFMCGTKGGGKPIGLADVLPRERSLRPGISVVG